MVVVAAVVLVLQVAMLSSGSTGGAPGGAGKIYNSEIQNQV